MVPFRLPRPRRVLANMLGALRTLVIETFIALMLFAAATVLALVILSVVH